MAATRTLVGMLTPSSNTVLEPVTTRMLAGLPEVSAHFSRFRVTEIALSADALGQFEHREIVRAAELLAHAKVDVVGWSGTSAGWLGFAADEGLCRRIIETTGIAACTSVLALNEIFQRTEVRTFGLVTPYTDDVQAAIVAQYAAAGWRCTAERHLCLRDNYSFSEVTEEAIAALVREVAAGAPDAIAILCTNLRGAPRVQDLERELGIPVYDSVATVVWKSLRLAGVDPARVRGWGRIFEQT